MKLIRYGSLPDIGVFGELDMGIHKYKTVEQPWRGNKPFKSCVPAGEYILTPHKSDRYGSTWALIGETVSQYQSEKQRYACLFHPANWAKDVQGCIGIGRELMYINGLLGVNDSRNSIHEFHRYMLENHERERLIIEWSDYEH
jgi:hypothetical protein